MIISLLLLFVMIISISVTFAADEDVALTEVDDEVTIEEDVLSVQENDEPLSIDDESIVEADDGSNEVLKESAVVTNDTFHNYFDESGSLLETVTEDELVFEGDFSKIDVNYITIDSELKLTGKNAVFKGVSFVIESNNVEINGFDLTGSDIALISISDVSDVTISNCKINFTAIEDFDSYAIYAVAVDNLKIINNNITYVGCTSGSSINNAIRILGDEEEEYCSENILIQNNNFDITLPSVAVSHPDMYSMKNTEIFSAGMDLIYCYCVNITDNEMDIKYNDHYGSVDTIYGISVRGNPMNIYADDPIVSEEILIKNNIIKATGYNHIYGILVAGNEFEVSDNQLTISADNYYANGIEIEGPSETGIVKNNTISVKAPGATYGIISGVLEMGSIDDIKYVDNTIDVESYFACGVELSQWNSEITNNYITAKGNYTVGICDSAKNAEYSIISKNTINCLGTNVGENYTGDTILGKESVAVAVLGDVTIEDNTISSTNVGIKAVEEGTIVIKNNNLTVIANSGKVDNHAIVVDDVDDLTISGNDVTFSGLVDYQFVYVGEDEYGWAIYDSSKNTKSYGVYVKDSNAVIKDNKFDIAIPTFANNWGATRETFSEGVVLTGCDDVVFENNDLVVSANGGNSWDSIYGLEVWNSANPSVKNNNITLNGAGYAYGIIINDENFDISKNNITTTSNMYACGIDVEGTANGNITGNDITAISSTNDGSASAYPVYSGMNYMPVTVEIKDNNIIGESYYVVGVEVGGTEALIENNKINVKGNHTVGVGSTVSTLTVNNNDIVADASNEGNDKIYDYIGGNTAGIKVNSGDAVITNNNISSNQMGINIASASNKANIENNNIAVAANKGNVDNYAIVVDDVDDLTISGNDVAFSGLVDYQFVYVGEDEYGWAIYDSSNNTRSYGVYVKNSNAVIKDNKFDIAIPTFANNWGATRETFSEGVVLTGCDDVVFENNDLVVSANGGNSWDSIYGLEVWNSANPSVKNNNITLNGAGYAYGIIINDENFDISKNNITTTSNMYACGIDVEGTANGNITGNDITAISSTNDGSASAYPVYSGMNNMPVTVEIKNNNIIGESYYVVGVEVGGTEALIENNKINVKGNHTVGVGSTVSTLTVNNNDIVADASNEGNDKIYDYIGGNNTGIKINSGDAVITNNNISSNQMGINIASASNKANIENNNIAVAANKGNVDNYAIVADDVDDLTISGNDVTFSGLVDNQFVVVGHTDWGDIYDSSNNTRSYGVYVKNSNAVIKDNKFDIAIPTFANNWGATRETFSEGVVLTGCDDVVFENNDLVVSANGGNSWDSIYGLEVWNSADPSVKNNNITLNGAGYAYGIIINDENFDISKNNITTTSNMYACGIDVEGTAKGNIENNNIVATSPTSDGSASAYPVYSGMNYMPVTVDIKNNNITGESYYVVGVEVGGTEALIENNKINVKGNHTIGVGSTVSELTVKDNTITSDASNQGNDKIYDYVGENTTGIKLVSGNATISNNIIQSTGDSAVDAGSNNATVTDNYLSSDKGVGEDAISGTNVNSSGNPATNNPFLKTILFAVDLTKVAGSDDKYVVKAIDENGNAVVNRTIEIILNGVSYTAKTDNNGLASFAVDLAEGKYVVTAKFAGDDTYGLAKSIKNNITVNPKPVAPAAPSTNNVVKKATKITAKKKTFKAKTKTKKYTITLKSGKTAIKKVRVTLKVKGKTYKATTNAKGKATFKIKNLKKKGKYTATIKFAGNKNYKASSKKVKITVKK